MAKKYLNRAWMTTATTGTGTITLGAAKSNDYFTFAEAGISNTDTVHYVIVDGTDVEIGLGTYTSSGTTLSRDTVIASRVGGTAGTSKLNLSGSATVYVTSVASDLQAVYDLLVNLTANSVLARAASSAGAASGVALSASQFPGRGSTGNVAACAPDGSTLEFSGTTLRVKDAGITPAKLSGAQSGSAPAYAARAWINFNGTGTPAARASGNVSSITDNAAGSWDINFTTAMADTNYTTVVSGGYYATDNGRSFAQVGPRANVATGSVRVYQQSSTTGATRQDVDEYNVVIFR